MIADRNWYLTRDRLSAVGEEDTRQATLLVARGCFLDDALARRYGIHPEQVAMPTDPSVEEKAGAPAARIFPAKASRRRR